MPERILFAEWRPPSDIPMEAPPAEIPQDPPEQEPTVPEEEPPPPEVEEEAGVSHTVRGSCDVCKTKKLTG